MPNGRLDPIPVLDHGYVKLCEAWGHGGDSSGDSEAGIICAARQSTQGSFRGWDKDERLLRYLYTQIPAHTGPFEFSGMVIEVQDPTCVVWEWVRHRTQSYAIMSSRYDEIPDLNYLPTADRCLQVDVKNKQTGAAKGSEPITAASAEWWLKDLADYYHLGQRVYQDGLRRGIPKEIARLALTFGRYWRMRASANLLNWLKFVTLRADPAAQMEIRVYAEAVATILGQEFPRTWALFEEARNKDGKP